jgi:hypothetical protein
LTDKKLLPFHLNYTEVDVVDKVTHKPRIIYFPFLSCRFGSPTKTSREVLGLLDSGSDGVIIPLDLAKYLGLPLRDADPMKVADGKSTPRWTSEVSIILGRAGRYCSPIDNVTVSIPRDGDPPILLGRDPIFQLYKITFIEAEKKFLMDPYKPK